jgi:hypothetical protein
MSKNLGSSLTKKGNFEKGISTLGGDIWPSKIGYFPGTKYWTYWIILEIGNPFSQKKQWTSCFCIGSIVGYRSPLLIFFGGWVYMLWRPPLFRGNRSYDRDDPNGPTTTNMIIINILPNMINGRDHKMVALQGNINLFLGREYPMFYGN